VLLASCLAKNGNETAGNPEREAETHVAAGQESPIAREPNGFSQRADISPYTIESGTYRILDYPINIRDQPTISGNVIGKLQLHDEIEVIENMGNPQVIGGVLQNWYKIKSSDREGYIWGGFIAIETVIYDIDNNGINDYFSYRISKVVNGQSIIDIQSDIFIYINNNRKKHEYDFNVYNRLRDWRTDGNTHIWHKVYFNLPYYDEDWDEWRGFSISFIFQYDFTTTRYFQDSARVWLSINGDIEQDSESGDYHIWFGSSVLNR